MHSVERRRATPCVCGQTSLLVSSLRDCIAVYVLRLYYFFHCTPPPPPPLKQQEGESGADFARRVFSAVFEDDVQRLLNMEARLG